MNEEKEIKNSFYNDKYFILGFNKFYEKIKQKKINITKSKLLKFYNEQEVAQRFKPKQKIKKLNIVKSTVPFKILYCDSMFITSLNITLLSFIDWYSKYVFVFAFKISKQLSSDKSAKCLLKVIDFIKNKNFSVENITCDNGSEFLGSFKNVCNKLKIKINYAFPGDKNKTSPIESFNRTLRSMIEKYRIVNNVNATNIFKIIKEIENIYNNSFHNSIKDFPVNLINGNKKIIQTENKNENKNENEKLNFEIGDKVRIYIKDDNNPFNKLSSLWSKEIYEIENFKNGYYELKNHDGKFSYSNLQKQN